MCETISDRFNTIDSIDAIYIENVNYFVAIHLVDLTKGLLSKGISSPCELYTKSS
jgi:hypothetical protein